MRFLSDENFNEDVVRGLLLRCPRVDVEFARDVLAAGTPDPDLLEWATRYDRIVLTHDRTTMNQFAIDRIAAGLPLPGVFIINDRAPLGAVISDLETIVTCTSDQSEWADKIEFLPWKSP